MFIPKRGNGFLSQCIHERAFTCKHTHTLGHKRAHTCAYTDEQISRSRFSQLRHRRTRKSTVLMAGLISMSSINTTQVGALKRAVGFVEKGCHRHHRSHQLFEIFVVDFVSRVLFAAIVTHLIIPFKSCTFHPSVIQ